MLLAWLVVLGPGTLSLDAMLARGLASAPLGAARKLWKIYELVERYMPPVLLLVSRGMHRVPEAPRVDFLLEANNDIIRIARNDYFTLGFPTPPPVGPEIEDFV